MAEDQTLTSSTAIPVRTKTPFEEFLIAEYNNIAHAHFNTVNSLSEFIKHYIVIVSLPISIALIFLKPAELKESGILEFLLRHPLLPAAFLSTVTLVGWFILGYVINLRCDALLYARTVNGIRKYFYNMSQLGLDEETHIRTLPRSTYFPKYIEWPYFFFVVLAFATVGTGYSSVGWYFYWYAKGWNADWMLGLLVSLLASAHVALYWRLGRHREREYLRGHIIGVDIDGVLNEHRNHFASVLRSQVNKEIAPESISRIPVHEIPDGGVTEADEHAVFNWPAYWNDMPPMEKDLGKIVGKLRNLLGYRVWIFTHRGWPQPSTFPPSRENEYWSAWGKLSWWAFPSRWKIVSALDTWLEDRGIPGFVRGKLIRSVTKRWLRRLNLHYDKIIIERGNTNTTDPLLLTRNRFLIARERKIRVFVEDDLLKAKKLANICEVVFLIDHPYNQSDAASLPPNLIRVKSWQEIYEYVRRVF